MRRCDTEMKIETPDSLGEDVLLALPDPIKTLGIYAYRRYMWMCVRWWVWWNYGRKYTAPLRPLFLYEVQPETIKVSDSSIPAEPKYAGVRDGSWDQNLRPRKAGRAYVSFKRRFVENREWEKTPMYENAIQTIENGGRWNGCCHVEAIFDYFDEYDRMYKDMRDHGYRSQREIDESRTPVSKLHDRAFRPPELREVTVDVSRDGDFILGSGGHRAAMATLLGIETIPVRIRLRHEQWQVRRDQVWMRETDEASGDHPDLIT